MTVKFRDDKSEILNVVDTGTAYGERIAVQSRSAKTMMDKFEEIWLCRHGAPSKFSADPEFCQPFFQKYLAGHGTRVNDRPA